MPPQPSQLRVTLSDDLMALLRSLVAPPSVAAAISHLSKQQETTMQNLADVQAKLADLSTKEDLVLALVQTEATELQALKAQVADLQAQIANAQPVDLQPLGDSIDGMAAKAQAVLDALNPPAPPADATPPASPDAPPAAP